MSWIENQANYYKNLHLRDRSVTAVIHVENKADESFWNTQLQSIKPGHYHFVSYSKNDDGHDVSGCEQCLKYRPYLNRNFFICIDSDLRLLTGEQGLNPSNFIAQTYTYSWENHLCETKHLQQKSIFHLENLEFSFVTFLEELSRILYRPLLYLVYHQIHGSSHLWNLKKFNQCIYLQPCSDDLKENGKRYLLKVKNYFDQSISTLNFQDDFVSQGLTPENAYLHIQGHQLYKLIIHIGSILTKGKRIAFKSKILDQNIPTSGYPEIDNLQSDLNTILF